MKIQSPHRRRSIRLPTYNYSRQGFYYVTICLESKQPLLGRMKGGEVVLARAGEIAVREWEMLTRRFPAVALDAFVVMPNHFHGIVQIGAYPSAGFALDMAQQAAPLRRPVLSEIVRAFKSTSAIAINRLLGCSGRVWQRNYYERVIRDEKELEMVRRYITQNPLRWMLDRENPVAELRDCDLELPWIT